jgi:hypothetical protein
MPNHIKRTLHQSISNQNDSWLGNHCLREEINGGGHVSGDVEPEQKDIEEEENNLGPDSKLFIFFVTYEWAE